MIDTLVTERYSDYPLFSEILILFIHHYSIIIIAFIFIFMLLSAFGILAKVFLFLNLITFLVFHVIFFLIYLNEQKLTK